jgi:hypothetical protein
MTAGDKRERRTSAAAKTVRAPVEGKPPQSPVEIVAAKVTERLLTEGLVRESDATSCREKLTRGTSKRSDWRLWIENALEEKGR